MGLGVALIICPSSCRNVGHGLISIKLASGSRQSGKLLSTDEKGNALIEGALGSYSGKVCWQLGGCNSDESGLRNEFRNSLEQARRASGYTPLQIPIVGLTLLLAA